MNNPVLSTLQGILNSPEHLEALALAKRDPEAPSSRRLLELAAEAERVLRGDEG